MPQVTLEACDAARRPALEALFQLYVHDFSEYWAGADRGELQEDGRFADYPFLDRYWREPERSAWFIRVDGHLAGFALLSASSHSGLPADHDMAEFFVVRKHRRGGVGLLAASLLITPRAGLWEIAVVRANGGAMAFWRKVAAACGPDVESLDVDDARWNGLILRFVVA